MAYVGSAIYARSGDVIYRYGGADGDTYDSRTAEVEMPFLNGATIATWKSWTAIDLMIEGLWKVYIATDTEQPDEEDLVAIVDKTTLSMLRSESTRLNSSHYCASRIPSSAGQK